MSRGAPDVFDIADANALLRGGDALMLAFNAREFGGCADELRLELRHARDAEHQRRVAVDGDRVRWEAQVTF